MRKKIGLIITFVFTALAISQTITVNKTKVESDSLKIKSEDEMNPALDSLLMANAKWKPFKKSSIASYYADKFNGRKTASGKRFSNAAFTAAHKKLPFGTKVKVTNEANGKFVVVEITDRGPFVRSKEIDLSKRAFMEIAENKRSGMMRVTLEIDQK